MSLPRRLSRLAFLALALGTAPAAAQPLPTRLNIDLLYAKSNDHTLEEHMQEWASSLHEKLQNTLAWDTSMGLAAANRIQVLPPAPQPTFPTALAIESRWRDRNAIQIVYGHGARSATVSAFEGNIYLGDFNGRLPKAIPIAQDINGGTFERSSNFVVVVTLYALSADAAARSQKATSCRLLQRARVLGQSLPPTLTSATLVKKSIEADLSARCVGGGS